MAFAQEFIIFVTGFVLVVPGFFRSQTFIEDVFRNGDVFPVAEILIAEVIEIVFLLAVFLARHVDQALGQIDIFIIVPVRREVITVFTEGLDTFDSFWCNAFHQERIAMFIEPFVHAQDAFDETAVFAGEGRDPELFLAAA